MPRPYFHRHECGHVIDDLEQGRAGALEAAREVMCAEVKEGRLRLSCRIDIADAAGNVPRGVNFRDMIVVSGL